MLTNPLAITCALSHILVREVSSRISATFAGDHAGMGIAYDIGLGGCKMVSHRKVKCGDLLSVHLNIPKQTTPIAILAAKVQWALEHGFGIEFLEIQKHEQARLERFLETQSHIAS